MNERIAVIMRSMNEQPHTRRALEGLFEQQAGGFELYNVDSGSTDGTLEVITEFNPDRLTRIRPEEYVPGRVLNRMIAQVEAPIIVLLNADAVPMSDQWLERLVAPIREGRADATMSVQVPRADALFIVAYDYARAYDPRNIKADNQDFFSAVACAFDRRLWERTPFREEGYAEDLAWAHTCRNEGARFELVTDSVVEHSHNYTLKQLYRKKYRHGVTFVHIYGAVPRPFRQLFQCKRELARDLLYAIRSLRITTIPYNIAYRVVIHWAMYCGLRDGQKGKV
ncbi:MAG: glycosyltransferase [Verrucomicrobiota bacterium]|jgi:rhamnosyltransferase|nr:glycosyltransferase [Verrucomicrobiota bacterium]